MGDRKRRWRLLAVLTVVLLAVAASSATAVHDLGIFELDENAVSGAAPGDDWETLAGGGGSSLVDTFVTDPVETPADDIFDGGQTKDTNNMNEWLWKGAEPNDKNDIEHAFAASYEHSSGDLIVYFGLDRMDNSGDAAAGFWFLKRPVEQKRLDSDGDGDMENVFVFEGTNTLATHSVGDTLVQTDFTNGGTVERIEAYQWGVAPAGTPVQPGSPLRQIATGADCDLAPANDTLCGQVNRNPETVPSNWPQLTVGSTTASYFFKGSGGVAASSTFPTATFFEGGINATKLLGSNFCAAQMLAETRQSQSETSTLEDKAEAGFELCAIDVEKTGPEKSKVGDDATYTIKITNTGAVTLFKQEVDDSLLGDLTGTAGCGASLAPGASCTITVDYTVQAGDPDPLINTVDVIYNRNSTLTGDQVTDSSSHSTNLFQPSIEVTKTGDELSKVGDVVNYTIKVCNTSSADSPALVKDSVSDNKIAGVNAAFGASLASGDCESHDFTRTVQAGDADPLVNTATAHYHPQGFPNDITDSDDHSTNLFQPSLTITKTGDALSKVGDDVNYTIEVCNTSSVDSPPLVKDSVSDNKIAGVNAAFGASLSFGECESHSFTRTVQAGDADPLVNTATAHYHPAGFPNDISDSDSHSTNLFQPSLRVTKTGDGLSKVGDDVSYTIEVCNTSSADSPALIKDGVSDNKIAGVNAAFGASLAPGDCESHDFTRTVQAGDPDPLVNTATAHYHPAGFPNDITDSDDHSTNLFQPSIELTKTGDELSKVGDSVRYTIQVCNTSSADSPNLIKDSVTDDKIAGVGAAFGASLAPGACESHNFTRTVQAGDADPLINTATAHYHPAGFPNDITDSDSHSTNLFQPSLTITKTGDELSKIGDAVDYTIKVCNTSSNDSPNLVKDSVNDTLIAGVNAAFGASLAPGACESHDFTRTVALGDTDPLVNTATAHYHPAGFPNDISDSDSHSTNLFQPSLTVTKTGDALSKVGDSVRYTIEVCNTSSADSPNLIKDSVTDNKIAGVGAAFGASLAPGACESHNFTRTVQAGDPDPLVNTATAHYHPAGFPNDISDSDSHSTNLFQPSIVLTKTADHSFSKAGDAVTYTVSILNTSSSDSPNLVLDSFSDSVVSSATAPASCSPLAPGAGCTFSYAYTVQAGDADPLVNTATAHYHPAGFPNDITGSGSASVDLLHPAFTVTKECTNAPVDQGGTASFKITYKNTGDADLVFTPAQPDEGGTVAVGAGQTGSVTVTRPVPDGATSVDNTVSGTVTLAAKYGLSNQYDYSASGSCSVKGKAKVVKTVSGQAPPAGQSFTFELRQGASTVSQGTVLETKSTDASGNISFTTQLIPGQTYQICEWVFPGWNTNLAGDGPLFVPESIIPPALPNPNVNNLTVCANFTVTSGQTRTFNVDNTPPPGGRALTIGFWKNWASCASSNGKGQKPMLDLALAFASQQTTNPPGGLVVSAQNPGSLWPNYAAAWYLVLKGNPSSTEKNILAAPDCAKAVNLLNKSTTDGKKKMSSDPLFNMTAQLVAAQLNRFMGAGISGITIVNIDRAVLLDGKYKFNGLTYTPALTAADANLANCLATQLDNYNNGRPVSACS